MIICILRKISIMPTARQTIFVLRKIYIVGIPKYTVLIIIFRVFMWLLALSQTTQIELKSKDCILLLKYLGIQFTYQLFSMVYIPNKVWYTSAPNIYKCKPSPDEIRSQQPKRLVVFHLVASFKALAPISSLSQTTHIELEPKDCL